MEKYYCEHCRSLSDYDESCSLCGCNIVHKIWIEVQTQENLHGEIRWD